jgi:hypothetical protein
MTASFCSSNRLRSPRSSRVIPAKAGIQGFMPQISRRAGTSVLVYIPNVPMGVPPKFS